MRRKFLANPAAGGGGVGREFPALVERIRGRLGPVEIEQGESWDDLRARAARAAAEGYDLVVALGGDGTVNAVANGLVGQSRTSLAVAPLGTGSDYFRGYAASIDWLDVLIEGVVRTVDVGEIRLGKSQRYFVNMASVGLSAEVVRWRQRAPQWIPGVFAYGLPALVAVSKLSPSVVSMKVNGVTLTDSFVTVFVAKGRYAGGGMKLGAAARLDDGKLALTAVRYESPLHALPRFPRLYRGNFDDPMFLTRTVTQLAIHTERPWPAECDGELLGEGALEIRVVPRALRLLAPADEPHV